MSFVVKYPKRVYITLFFLFYVCVIYIFHIPASGEGRTSFSEMETIVEIEINESINEENHNDLQEIPSESADNLTYNQFFHRYMERNIPVLISGIKIKTEISEKWFENDELKLEKLQSIIKDHNVPVANCSKQVYDAHEKDQMKFTDYVQYWKDRRSEDILYLKDFHMKQEFPELDFYNVPQYFSSDWLNEYLIDNSKDDYRFIYFGPENSW